MRTTLDNNNMTIYIDGHVDSANAAVFEKDLLSAMEANPGTIVTLDAKDLTYISSAGLRVLMKLRKELKGTYPVVNVSSEVYDIFEVTGFTDLLDVRKALREVDITGCELIGKGGNGAVYRLDPETIVKVYYGVSNPLEKIEQDRLVSRNVFTQGINTAIPFDTVKVGSDYGVVFEMVDTDTLGQFLSKHPDDLEAYTHKMVAFLKQLHSTEFAPGALQDARNLLYHRINISQEKGLFTEDEARIMRAYLERMPTRNTFVHGDFHPGNIMVRDGELILIDVGDSGLGHPINDLTGMYLMYVIAAQNNSSEMYCGLAKEPLERMWPMIIQDYFDVSDDVDVKHYMDAIAGAASLKLMLGVAVNPNIPEEIRLGALNQIKPSFFENVDRIEIVP